MGLMLCDHLWATVVPGNDWLTDIGRIAFPIFAFMTAEGFFHTKNLKKYVLRMLGFALISEIPFNLMMSSSLFYPVHQNVLWTFLIAIGLMWLNEKAKGRNIAVRVLIGLGTALLGYILGILSFADYNGAGVLMVLVFYFFRGRKWWCFLAQLFCLWYINTEILSGFFYVWEIFGTQIEILRQSFALFALIPIWLYRGEQGYYSKGIKNLYYWFYPVHMLLLCAAREIII
ncbi:MAG: conjugal transfer protein TraX [Oscillospiraceae bacterium]|nr:conjugal transfer protein TraX [Oscillospiraceae bacterium]